MKQIAYLAFLCAFAATTGSAAVLLGVSDTDPYIGVDLTANGTVDWAVWDHRSNSGVASRAASNTKSGGPGLFSAITPIGEGNVRGFSQSSSFGEQTFSFTDGTDPETYALAPISFVAHSTLDTVGRGLSLTIQGDPAQLYKVDIWTAGYRAVGQLTATLNGADPLVLESRAFESDKDPSLFTITFRPDNAEDLLNLEFILTVDNDNGNNAHVGIQAITVSAVPEPVAGLFVWSGLLALAAPRRRKRSGSD
jgi:hypothetical protein